MESIPRSVTLPAPTFSPDETVKAISYEGNAESGRWSEAHTGVITDFWQHPFTQEIKRSPRLIEVNGKQFWYYTIKVPVGDKDGKLRHKYIHRVEHELRKA